MACPCFHPPGNENDNSIGWITPTAVSLSQIEANGCGARTSFITSHRAALLPVYGAAQPCYRCTEQPCYRCTEQPSPATGVRSSPATGVLSSPANGVLSSPATGVLSSPALLLVYGAALLPVY